MEKMNRHDDGDLEKGRRSSFTSDRTPIYEQKSASNRPAMAPHQQWMARVSDDTPLSAMTIPGTHDSAAYTYSWAPFVTTQKINIRKQLNAGIRYFDLRCALRDDSVEMVHGPTWLGLFLEDVLDVMYTWLERHPSEALVVQIKQDRKGKRSSVDFAQAISALIALRSERWRTANTIPTIGMVRGRIQLFRRFEGESLVAYGLDVTEWEDNPREPFTICTMHGVRLTIQDHYNFPSPESLPSLITKKGHNIAILLERASGNKDPNHWYINFASAYELNVFYQLNPHEVAVGGYWGFRWAQGINVRLGAYLRQARRRKECYGIVAMDFPEQGADDLVTSLVLSNFAPNSESVWACSRFWMRMVVIAVVLCGCWFFGLYEYSNPIDFGLI